MVLVGSHVNEDTELGHIAATGDGMGFVSQSLPSPTFIYNIYSCPRFLGSAPTSSSASRRLWRSKLSINFFLTTALLTSLSANEVDKLKLTAGSLKIVNGRLELPSMQTSEPPAPPKRMSRRPIQSPVNAQAGPSRQTVVPLPSLQFSSASALQPRLKLEPLPAADYANLKAVDKDEAQRQRTRERNDRSKEETTDLQERLSLASIADLGVDFFRTMPPKNGFGWTRTPTIAKTNNVVIIGYPFDESVRLPTQFKGSKGSGSMRQPERNILNDSLDARVIPGQGLRFFKRPYVKGIFPSILHAVILT